MKPNDQEAIAKIYLESSDWDDTYQSDLKKITDSNAIKRKELESVKYKAYVASYIELIENLGLDQDAKDVAMEKLKMLDRYRNQLLSGDN